MTYTFHIRQDAKFHDGKKVTANDFKWSLDRAADPNTASPVAETYLGDIIGVEDVLKGRVNSISGVTVIDDKTLEIKIFSKTCNKFSVLIRFFWFFCVFGRS